MNAKDPGIRVRGNPITSQSGTVSAIDDIKAALFGRLHKFAEHLLVHIELDLISVLSICIITGSEDS